MGGYPIQFWTKGNLCSPALGPDLDGRGDPRVPPCPDLGWGTCPMSRPGMGYPHTDLGTRYPHPHPDLGRGYPPPSWLDGVPPPPLRGFERTDAFENSTFPILRMRVDADGFRLILCVYVCVTIYSMQNVTQTLTQKLRVNWRYNLVLLTRTQWRMEDFPEGFELTYYYRPRNVYIS